MKILVKMIGCIGLFLLSMSSFSQEKWTFGLGYGASRNFDGMRGNEQYFSGAYSLNENWAISTRVSYTRVKTVFHPSSGLIQPGTKSLLFQPEINWIIVKKPFILYPSLGVAVGREWYPDLKELRFHQDRFVWGPNVGLNLDIPFGRFSVGTRFSGNTLIDGDYGNAFFSFSGVVKYRLGGK